MPGADVRYDATRRFERELVCAGGSKPPRLAGSLPPAYARDSHPTEGTTQDCAAASQCQVLTWTICYASAMRCPVLTLWVCAMLLGGREGLRRAITSEGSIPPIALHVCYAMSTTDRGHAPTR
eukprot:3811242-Rhodomonas_salina.4